MHSPFRLRGRQKKGHPSYLSGVPFYANISMKSDNIEISRLAFYSWLMMDSVTSWMEAEPSTEITLGPLAPLK